MISVVGRNRRDGHFNEQRLESQAILFSHSFEPSLCETNVWKGERWYFLDANLQLWPH